MKIALVALLLIALLGLAAVLGGSMIWVLDGADALNVDGVAKSKARPANTIDVGDEWRYYGGDAGGHRYSKAAEITPANVNRLAPVWEFQTGDITHRADYMQ